MTLVVDIGNSRIKWAQAIEGSLLGPGEACHAESPEAALEALARSTPSEIDRVLVTNVAGEVLGSALGTISINRWGVAPNFVTPVAEGHGITCGYTDPSRLGADRWVALIAAHRLTGGAACVIDAGTTVTLDAADAEGQHLGGIILAGPRIISAALRRETSGIGQTAHSMATATGGAPSGIRVLGRNTDEAVANGAMLSLAGALDRALSAVSGGLGAPPTVYITGGDARVLSTWLESATQYRANLVLEGLAFIAAEA